MVKMRTFRLSEWLAPETEVSNGFGLGFSRRRVPAERSCRAARTLHTSKSKAYWAITSDVHRTKHMTKAGERQAPHDPNSVHYDLAKWLQVTE